MERKFLGPRNKGRGPLHVEGGAGNGRLLAQESWEGSRVMHRVTEAHVSDAAEALVRGAPAMD